MQPFRGKPHDPVSEEDPVTNNDSRENHIPDKYESSKTLILQCNSIIQYRYIDVLHASKKLNAIT